MTNLYEEGGLSSYIGRPLGMVSIPPSYNITFFNKTMDNALAKLNFVSESTLSEYREDLSISTAYTRVLHFNVVDTITGNSVAQPYYVPFVDNTVIENGKSIINVKPLVEVIDPTFIQNKNSEIVMYFFSNFNYEGLTGSSVSAIYNDESNFLRRTVEFATNNADSIHLGSSSSNTIPQFNNKNLYADGFPEDDKPKLGFLSCFLKIGQVLIGDKVKMFVFAEKPRFITFIGERFNLDFHPPMLVNGIQKLEWAKDKAASDNLDNNAINDNPQRQVPYHHLINGIETVMSPGYAGINFKTKPINDLYDKSLDHIFQVNDKVRKDFDIGGLNLTRISVRQEDFESVDHIGFLCSKGICGSSSSAILWDYYRITTTDSNYYSNSPCSTGSFAWSWDFWDYSWVPHVILKSVGENCYTRYGTDCSIYFPDLNYYHSLAFLYGGPGNWKIKVVRGIHRTGEEDPCISKISIIDKSVQSYSPIGNYGSDWAISNSSLNEITNSSYDLNRHFVVFDVRTNMIWKNYRLITYDDTPFPLRTSDNWVKFFGNYTSMFDIGGNCYSVKEAMYVNSYKQENNANIGVCPPSGPNYKQWLNFCICGGPKNWKLEVVFYTYSNVSWDWRIIKSESIEKTFQTEEPNGCYGNLWYVLDKEESVSIGGNPCASLSSSSSSEINKYNVEIPASVNLWGKDKPEFWKKYWSECGLNPGTPMGGTIEIIEINETLWEGTACIDGINMYVTLKADPIWNYDSINRRKWNLELGLMAAVGGKFDVIWTGSKTENIDIEGVYDRKYALGDSISSTIEIVIP